jgi:C4-dicarboxylate-specific signal transduction histidine kinase
VPGGSEIRYRDPGVWEQYRWTIVSALGVLGLQTALIIGLVYERRGRRRAEIETRQRTSELAHMNRHATAGELSASIAHELNQPLGAILNNTEAAIAILESPSPNVEEIKRALADIKRDDQRASEIILQLRRLLKKSETDSRDIDLNETVRQVLVLLSAEAASRNVSLHDRLSRQTVRVRADSIQLQQVILNLIVNAIESIDDSASGPRQVVSGTALVDEKWGEVFVADSGPGISPENMTRVFEPLFTTKERGMGMGLSIARTIVEAQGGRIWAENQSGGGAVFHIRLPLAKAH